MLKFLWHRWQQMVATGYLKVQVLEHEQRLNPNTEFKHMMKHPVRDLEKKKNL